MAPRAGSQWERAQRLTGARCCLGGGGLAYAAGSISAFALASASLQTSHNQRDSFQFEFRES